MLHADCCLVNGAFVVVVVVVVVVVMVACAVGVRVVVVGECVDACIAVLPFAGPAYEAGAGGALEVGCALDALDRGASPS